MKPVVEDIKRSNNGDTNDTAAETLYEIVD